MYEGYTPSDDFAETGEFDEVIEQVIPSVSIPVGRTGTDLKLTPANAAVRLFLDEAKEDYNRVLIYLDDGSEAMIKPPRDFMLSMVRGGFPVELPHAVDESDQEFLDEYMHVWSQDTYDELGLV